MSKPIRIDAREAFEKVQAGDAVLVCAYRSEEKCRRIRLQGALTLGELRHRLGGLPRDLEVIFYCS